MIVVNLWKPEGRREEINRNMDLMTKKRSYRIPIKRSFEKIDSGL